MAHSAKWVAKTRQQLLSFIKKLPGAGEGVKKLNQKGATMKYYKDEYRKAARQKIVEKIGNQPLYGIERVPNLERPWLRYIEFRLGEGPNLTADNVDPIMESVEENLGMVDLGLIGWKPYYRLTLRSDLGQVITTTYSSEMSTLLGDVRQKLLKFSGEYGIVNEALSINDLRVDYILTAMQSIKGTAKTIRSAHRKWYMPDTRTRLNCLFVAIYTGLHWHTNGHILYDATARSLATRVWKCRLELPESIKNDPDVADLPIIAEHLSLSIRTYNNIYELTNTYGSGEPIDILILNNSVSLHAIPMIEWRRINPAIVSYIKEQAKGPKDPKGPKTFKKIQPLTHKPYNERIAAWDVETYMVGGKFTVYLSGLTYKMCGEVLTKQFETPNARSNENLKLFADFLYEYREWLDQYTFYAHNGGKFDLVLLMRDVFLADSRFQIVNRRAIELNNSWISLVVDCGGYKFKFLDSFKLMPGSLAQLTRDYKVEHPKIEFDVTKITPENVHGYFPQILKYHRFDCISLYELVEKFSRIIHDKFEIDVTACPTSASLSKAIFMTCYYPRLIEKKKALYTLTAEEESFFRKGYYGGRNECGFLGHLTGKFYYYDFTSLYPYAGCSILPVGRPIPFKQATVSQMKTWKVGYARCMVTGTSQMLKGMPPLHCLKLEGRLTFPYLETPTEMYLWFNEILYGMTLGYTYEILEGYYFDHEAFLRDYFTDLFKYKDEASQKHEEASKQVYKLLINSGYGYWGFNTIDKDTLVMSSDESHLWRHYLEKKQLSNLGYAGSYCFMRVKTSNNCISNVSIASSITANARIILHKLLVDIKLLGGRVYYMDTDSIITDLRISDHVYLKKKYQSDGKGNGLGMLKNELDAKTGVYNDSYFDDLIVVGCKMYSISVGNVEVNRLKGYKRSAGLERKVLVSMYEGESVTQSQTQLLINKTDYLRETDPFQIRLQEVVKGFKMVYTKGTLVDDGKNKYVVPLTI